ncbi:MAG: Rrf2 family transcriptional regulator [Gemmataceae bacterium]|nr:Rrf2 family transcriptional regulator [Gemmataceae bacterium]
MKISAQEEYGLRCLLRLAKAPQHTLTLPEIAAAEGMSVPYVAKLMAVMRDAGLIDSLRGRCGGYRLSRPPEEIGLGSLLLTLGEPLYDEGGYCQRHSGTAPHGVCVHQNDCSLRALWATLEQWMRGTLNQITLADLMEHEGRIVELLRARLATTVFDAGQPLIPLGVRSR